MRDRWPILAVVATLVVVAVAAAQAESRPQRFDLEANVAGLSASAAILGSGVTISVEGARPGAHLDAAVALVACARPFVRRGAGTATADGAGSARWTVSKLVSRSFRDGRHVLALWSGARMVACAAIPSGTGQPQPRSWGLRSFAWRFAD